MKLVAQNVLKITPCPTVSVKAIYTAPATLKSPIMIHPPRLRAPIVGAI